jgi:hypothetical protein
MAVDVKKKKPAVGERQEEFKAGPKHEGHQMYNTMQFNLNPKNEWPRMYQTGCDVGVGISVHGYESEVSDAGMRLGSKLHQ